MVFNNHEMVHDMTKFVQCDWSKFYPGIPDVELPNVPELRQISNNDMLCRHQSCWLACDEMFAEWRPNLCQQGTNPMVFKMTKHHGNVYVWLRIHRGEDRMMGIEVSGPMAMFCDNESMVKSSMHPESMLQKKHNVIAYHRV
jgi:hypothetical protein